MKADSANSTASSQSGPEQPLEWTLERVKLEISQGSVIQFERIVDIGNGLLVKYGKRVRPQEAEATTLVATHTSVPVPKIHATLYDEATSMTYIVQSKLPGRSLEDVLPTLQPDQQATIEEELKEILHQLSLLDTYGPMGMVGHPSKFFGYQMFEYHGPWEATNLWEFLNWPINTCNSFCGPVHDPVDFSNFDLQKPPVFSHGDLVPHNILIHDGHVSGIIDWELAGWYPYFWNAYIAQKGAARYPKPWPSMIPKIMATYKRESVVFNMNIYRTAYMFLCT